MIKTQDSIEKILAKGFEVFRLREDDKSIWYATPKTNENGQVIGWTRGWSLYGKFDTKTEAKKHFKEILKEEYSLEG